MSLKKYSKFYNHIIIFFFSSSIFLSFLKFEYFQFRYLVLFLSIPCIINFFEDLKNKNYKFIKYFLLFLSFFFIHLSINLYLDNEGFSSYNFFSLFYLLAILSIAYYFKNIFKLFIVFIYYKFFRKSENTFNLTSCNLCVLAL